MKALGTAISTDLRCLLLVLGQSIFMAGWAPVVSQARGKKSSWKMGTYRVCLFVVNMVVFRFGFLHFCFLPLICFYKYWGGLVALDHHFV